ncbi:MAG: HTH domain-containing protein [Elusimicrobiota bacterium]
MIENNLKQYATLKGHEFWEHLVHRIGFLDIKILENLYIPSATTTYFNALLKKMNRLNVKRTAIRNHIDKLEELGLIETIKSGILLVNSIPEIQDNVKKLIIRCKLRWDI